MGSLLPLIIQLASGALGGNAAGALFKNLSLGPIWNSVAGIAGGGLGSVVLGAIGLSTGDGGMDLAGILGSVAGGGVGGGLIMAVVGLIKNAMGSKS